MKMPEPADEAFVALVRKELAAAYKRAKKALKQKG